LIVFKIARAKNSGGAAGGLPAMLRKAIAGGGGRRAGLSRAQSREASEAEGRANTLKFDIFDKRSANKKKKATKKEKTQKILPVLP